jgi:hypothetical protein
MAEIPRRFLGSSIAVAALAMPTLACTGKDPYNPGTPLGTFQVTARLETTSCGPAPDPWAFDVRLGHEDGTIYWIQGGAPASGTLDHDKRVVMRVADDHTLRPAAARKPACVVTREDVLDVVLGGEGGAALTDASEAASFAGVLTYRFTPQAESECSDQLAAFGGDLAALPCEVRYVVEARRLGERPAPR